MARSTSSSTRRDRPDRLGSRIGHLVVFDRDPEKSWEEKIYRRDEDYEGKTITVWGM